MISDPRKLRSFRRQQFPSLNEDEIYGDYGLGRPRSRTFKGKEASLGVEEKDHSRIRRKKPVRTKQSREQRSLEALTARYPTSERLEVAQIRAQQLKKELRLRIPPRGNRGAASVVSG